MHIWATLRSETTLALPVSVPILHSFSDFWSEATAVVKLWVRKNYCRRSTFEILRGYGRIKKLTALSVSWSMTPRENHRTLCSSEPHLWHQIAPWGVSCQQKLAAIMSLPHPHVLQTVASRVSDGELAVSSGLGSEDAFHFPGSRSHLPRSQEGKARSMDSHREL